MWHEHQMVAFDVETTGIDPFTDRIVTACIARITGGDVDVTTWLLDPEIEIPTSASDIHGVTTDKARADGQDYKTGVREIRDALNCAWNDECAVVAFNANFDLTMLDTEGRRLGMGGVCPGLVVDPFVLDSIVDRYRRGRRTLAATCEHYGVRLGTAHQADADALGAARLAWRLAQHPQLADLTADQVMAVQADGYRARQESRAAWLLGQGKSIEGMSTAWPIRRPDDAPMLLAEEVPGA